MADAKLNASTKIDITISVSLSLAEAEALQEFTGYGYDAFLKGYKKQLGSAYISKREVGLKSLFGTIDGPLSKEVAKAKKYRDNIMEASRTIEN